jgi:hypothetical protein
MEIRAREAKHGEKMIELKVRFWTDGLSPERGKVLAKHAWTSGVVRIERNKAHGIIPSKPVPFNSLLGVGTALEETLKRNGVVLHRGCGMKKYLACDT